MNIDIQYKPSNTAAKITLQANEECVTEAGSMIAMSGNMQVTTSTHKKKQGNILKSLKRMLAGESFFLNHYNTEGGKGELWVSSALPGDMKVCELNGKTLIVQSGSFLAMEPSIQMDIGWQGFKTLFSGESLFWLKIAGQGKVLLSSFGAIYEEEVDGEYIVDTGHIVAFEDSLSFKISKAGSSWIHSFLGGEGLVCKFSGKGKVWCQSHNAPRFGNALTSSLRSK